MLFSAFMFKLHLKGPKMKKMNSQYDIACTKHF